jgi:hypothetical protein
MGGNHVHGRSGSHGIFRLLHCLADDGILVIYERLDIWRLALYRYRMWYKQRSDRLRPYLPPARKAENSSHCSSDLYGNFPWR